MDAATLHRWYENHGYLVHRRCLRLLGSVAEADDALHEVFLRAHRYGDTLRASDPLSWLYKLGDRYCLDLLARQRRQATVSQTQNALEHQAEQPSGAAAP